MSNGEFNILKLNLEEFETRNIKKNQGELVFSFKGTFLTYIEQFLHQELFQLMLGVGFLLHPSQFGSLFDQCPKDVFFIRKKNEIEN